MCLMCSLMLLDAQGSSCMSHPHILEAATIFYIFVLFIIRNQYWVLHVIIALRLFSVILWVYKIK